MGSLVAHSGTPSNLAILNAARGLKRRADEGGEKLSAVVDAFAAALGDGWKSREGPVIDRLCAEARAPHRAIPEESAPRTEVECECSDCMPR